MKTFFENPEIEVKKFSAMEDILTTSGTDFGESGENDGEWD